MSSLYVEIREALRTVVPDTNLIDAATAAADTAVKWINDVHGTSTEQRPTGACAALTTNNHVQSRGVKNRRASCIYDYNHTGAHRDNNGDTW